jgi:hypothetical protein
MTYNELAEALTAVEQSFADVQMQVGADSKAFVRSWRDESRRARGLHQRHEVGVNSGCHLPGG